jgi:phenylalanyl-tRNA synthetase alpha chain
VSLTLATSDLIERSLAIRDLADPAQGPHAMQLIVEALVDALSTRWGCPAIVHRASPIVSIHDNYERLRYPPDAVTREARYTRYVSDTTVLRSHITAMIPGLLDRLATERTRDDALLAPVGLVYRRDAIDRLHVGEPHQIDLWRIRRGRLGEAELRQMIDLVAGVLAPGAAYRTVPAEHPYTLDGREIYAERAGRWVEIGECGLAHPELLRDCGLDPHEWSGLAIGIGLDRAVMLRKGLDDIRLLRSGDPRIAAQMLDLEEYRPVSSMPAIRRDLSIAAAPGLDAETLGDCVRQALGDRASAVEEVSIVSETAREDLPPQAVERIGIQPGQVNLLVRLVLRHPTQTLTDHAANLLRDEVYATLHEGASYQWAAR